MSRPPLAAAPTGHVEAPAAVLALAAGDELTPVWRNGLGGLTFRADGPGGARFIKWAAAGTPETDFAGEAERLEWLRAHGAAVPTVVSHGEDEAGSWLVTHQLAGESAVSPRWLSDPAAAARAIGAGLRQLHDALPVADCPYSWSTEERKARVLRRLAAAGEADGLGSGIDDAHRALGAVGALAMLAAAPTVDKLVVCHGDPCAPNTLIDKRGEFAGHVDMGEIGVADRWADIAVAAWSTVWNYGPGFEALVYEGYGIEPDERRIAYYRLLWDLE